MNDQQPETVIEWGVYEAPWPSWAARAEARACAPWVDPMGPTRADWLPTLASTEVNP